MKNIQDVSTDQTEVRLTFCRGTPGFLSLRDSCDPWIAYHTIFNNVIDRAL